MPNKSLISPTKQRAAVLADYPDDYNFSAQVKRHKVAVNLNTAHTAPAKRSLYPAIYEALEIVGVMNELSAKNALKGEKVGATVQQFHDSLQHVPLHWHPFLPFIEIFFRALRRDAVPPEHLLWLRNKGKTPNVTIDNELHAFLIHDDEVTLGIMRRFNRNFRDRRATMAGCFLADIAENYKFPHFTDLQHPGLFDFDEFSPNGAEPEFEPAHITAYVPGKAAPVNPQAESRLHRPSPKPPEEPPVPTGLQILRDMISRNGGKIS